jgi:hypothetical protein
MNLIVLKYTEYGQQKQVYIVIEIIFKKLP